MTVLSDPVQPVLARTRQQLLPVLTAAIDRLTGPLRHMCGYQLGLLGLDGAPTGRLEGKLLRPAFTLLCADATGAELDDVLPAAAAIELLHNACLVHDDVMDRDLLRRHQPTVWAHFGVGEAVLAGDALIGLAFEVLADRDHPAARAALSRLAVTLRLLGQGQERDLRASARAEVSVADCLATFAGKTGSLFGCACRFGALFAPAGPEVAERFDRFGTDLGIAFQLADDLLDIWGDTAITGKPASDLRARRKSAPVVYALARSAELREMYAAETEFDDEATAAAVALIEATGAGEWTRAEAARRTGAAWLELDGLPLDPVARGELSHLAAAIMDISGAAPA
ncbi:polyprenyl synthetase family protein [Nocardia asteroides]|uniref:polyprenyl synthetase family protein n=1 Tax=Nocardia asteroides TaxID=1824 RepID=UPI001E43C903|nr:polyprenyl synthetase family protein [Nocardia asteroides]UGT62211.1 polyprenyl synthetase family protein [Nocardia asteroides]